MSKTLTLKIKEIMEEVVEMKLDNRGARNILATDILENYVRIVGHSQTIEEALSVMDMFDEVTLLMREEANRDGKV